MDLDGLDRVGDEAMTVRHGGRVGDLPHPASLSWQQVAGALSSTSAFMATIAPTARVSLRGAEALAEAWRAYHDLPTFEQAQRIIYLVGRYHDDLEIDIPELGELWRTRQWRRLLNRLDHLPRWSWYARAVAQDEEAAQVMARRIVAQRAAQDEPQARGHDRVDMVHWTPDVEMLTRVINELRMLRHQHGLANSAKGSRPKVPDMLMGPETALMRELERAEVDRRQAAHQRVVAMFLPHKARPATLPPAPSDV